MQPRSAASSLAGFVKLGAVVLLLTALPSASAFNSYLAGLKYYQLGSCLTNAPILKDKPRETAPDTLLPPSGYLLGDTTPTSSSGNMLTTTTNDHDEDEYVRGGTLPMLLGEALPDLFVTPAPASTSLDGADKKAAANVMDGMAVSTSFDSSSVAEVSEAGVVIPSTSLAYATGSISAKVDKSVKSYSPFGAKCKDPAVPVPAPAAGGTYLDRLRLVPGSSEDSNIVDSSSFSVDKSQPATVASSTSTEGPTSVPRRAASYLGFGSKPKKVLSSSVSAASTGYLDGIASGGRSERRSIDGDDEVKPAQPLGDPPSAATDAYDNATLSADKKMVTLNQYSMPSYTTVTGIPDVDGDDPEDLRVEACAEAPANQAGAVLSSIDVAPSSPATVEETLDMAVRCVAKSSSPPKESKFTVFGRKPVAVPESVHAWANAGPVSSAPVPEIPNSAAGADVKSNSPAKESKFTVFGRKPVAVPESVHAWANAGPVSSAPVPEIPNSAAGADVKSNSPAKESKFTVFGRKPVAVPESVHAWANVGPVRQDAGAGAEESTNQLGDVPGPSASVPEIPNSAAGSVVTSNASAKHSKFTVFGRKPVAVPASFNAWANAGPARRDAGVEASTDQASAVPDPAVTVEASSDCAGHHDVKSNSPAKEAKFTVFGRKPKVVPDSFNAWETAGTVRHDASVETSTNQLGAVRDPSATVQEASDSAAGHEVKSNAPVKESKFAAFGRKPIAVPASSNTWMTAGPVRPSRAVDVKSTPVTPAEAATTFVEPAATSFEPHSVAASSASVKSAKKSSYSGFGVKPKAPDAPNALAAGYLRGLALPSMDSDDAPSVLSETETTVSPVSESAEQAVLAVLPDDIATSTSAPTALKKPSFSGFGVKHVVKTNAKSWEPPSDSSIELASVTGTDYLKSIAPSSSSTATPKGSFTGFGTKPTARHSGDGYLHGLASSSVSPLSFTSAPVTAESATHTEPEIEPAVQDVPPSHYVNVAQSILPVTSAESTWASGKSLRECSGATSTIGSPSSGASASSARAPPAPDAKPLPLINSYAPTQWTLNRQQEQQQNAAAESKTTVAGTSHRIFTGATIESIDSSLKAADFAPPLVSDAASTSSPAAAEINTLLPRGADATDGEEMTPSNSAAGDVLGKPDMDDVAVPMPSAPAEIRQSVLGASYLASLTTPAATSTASHGVVKRKAAASSSYLGFGASSWRRQPAPPNAEADSSSSSSVAP
jgi:hypothetical protein